MAGRAREAGKTLLVASTGGHLEELFRLQGRLSPAADACEWVTFDDPQSRSLLAGQRVRYVRYVPPRGYYAASTLVQAARRLLRRREFGRVVSTGAGAALPFLALGRLYGATCHYIESAARAEGPSLTGRVASRIPGIHLYSQYQPWALGPWQYRGSLFDAYRATPRVGPDGDGVSRVVVSLGTQRTYTFRRAVESLTRLLPEVLAPGGEILWQVGCTDVSDLPIPGRDRVPFDEMREAIAGADLVIAHAGVGSALTALDSGKCPVLLPRSRSHGEHVDDHQHLIADHLAARGLAVSVDPGRLTAEHLFQATRTTVTTNSSVSPFVLAG